MKKMGFFGFALAITFSGDVTVVFVKGLATLSGKSLEPSFQGALVWSSAGGAGNWLFGVHVIGSGGIDGKFGCGGALGCFGGGVFDPVLVPHAVNSKQAARKIVNEKIVKGRN